MTTTILAAIALYGSLVPAAKVELRTDYAHAMKLAADEKKPMAVLIGKGDTFATLMNDAGLSAEAKKLLAEKYVCVTVDVTTEGGKSLAGQFQLTDGLVISSAGGNLQALRQAGTVTGADLSKHAVAFANVSATPDTTVTAGAPTAAPYTVYPAGYAPTYSSCPGGNCPNVVRPAGGYVFPSSGGCPNGRCPTYVR
ncbi:thioredoxin domain-containing protein [Frigoriglobus tundricola]|uniref:Uncharacterized protein n=1 Tax=Frigoriglobus tundricola TaxID=2774151 RepID=A0A6M5YUV1_9BACT|nr:hypothetical protein [Frigoriglobus tundricola]QJW97877.1 hypothetical protein FTUN_5457 [Frigoriglobus tundricola]